MSTTSPKPPLAYLDTALAISQIGDQATMRGMLEMLEETLQRDVTRISELLHGGQTLQANHLLHPLKGFLPIFCGPALCDRVAEVEQMSKDMRDTTVVQAYDHLMPALTQLLAEVSEYLNGDLVG
jgi:HPt (histidine-containing phosphotransfer) domain-containing protein